MTITIVDNSARSRAAALTEQASPEARTSNRSDDDSFTFDDLIDIINPLQHIPVVSTIYRAITGDDISVKARAIGGGLYGGPIGLLAAGATMAVEEATGLTAEGTLASVFSDDDSQVAALDADTERQRQALVEVQAAAAATEAPAEDAAAPGEAEPPQAQAFRARGETRFFQLPPRGEGREVAAAPVETAARQAPAAQSLTAAQGDLLQRFIQNNSGQGDARATSANPYGAAVPAAPTAEWVAAQMEANLQKYAAAQAAGARPGG